MFTCTHTKIKINIHLKKKCIEVLLKEDRLYGCLKRLSLPIAVMLLSNPPHLRNKDVLTGVCRVAGRSFASRPGSLRGQSSDIWGATTYFIVPSAQGKMKSPYAKNKAFKMMLRGH